MLGYIIVGGIGATFLVISLIFAEIGDLLGNLEHDISGHGASHTGPGFLNLRAIMAFLTGFGAVGALCTYLGWPALLAALPATGTGVLMSIAAWGFSVLLYVQQGGSGYTTESLVGLEATVTTPIYYDTMGAVTVDLPTGTIKLAATCSDHGKADVNERVRIVQILNQIAFVAKIGGEVPETVVKV